MTSRLYRRNRLRAVATAIVAPVMVLAACTSGQSGTPTHSSTSISSAAGGAVSPATTGTSFATTGSAVTGAVAPAVLRGAPIKVGSVTAPAEPAPMQLSGDGEAQATQLVKALATVDDTRPAALVAAFDAAGLPIEDDSSATTATYGKLGVPWTWAWAGPLAANPDARFPISTLAAMFSADGTTVPKSADPQITADMVTALRSALSTTSTAPGIAPVARLVQVEAKQFNGTDLADPKATADELEVSAPTAAVLIGAGLVVSLHALSTAAYTTTPATTGLRSAGTAIAASVSPLNCNPEEGLGWGLWVPSPGRHRLQSRRQPLRC